MREIHLGDEVKDTVTGFKGIATGITQYLNGCRRIGAQGKVSKDGKVPDTFWFDEPQLEIVQKSIVKVGPQDTGGPLPSIPTRNLDAKR